MINMPLTMNNWEIMAEHDHGLPIKHPLDKYIYKNAWYDKSLGWSSSILNHISISEKPLNSWVALLALVKGMGGITHQ